MSMLRLVPPEGQPPKPPRRKYVHAEPTLTKEEMDRVKVVLHQLRRRWGTWKALAEVIGGINPRTLCVVAAPKGRPQPGHALFAARVANVPVEAILSGTITLAGSCTCGCGK